MPAGVRPRLTTLALVGFGTLIGHGLAYALSGSPVAGDPMHGYLRVVAAAVVPLVFVVMIVLIRRDGAGMPGLVELVGYQTVLYVLQESLERGAMGVPPNALAGDPVLWWGLGAQLAAATIARGSVRLSLRLVRAWRRLVSRREILGVVSAVAVWVSDPWPDPPSPHRIRPRAPPVAAV